MTGIRFRDPEVRMSQALAAAEARVTGADISLRDLLALLGEQGLLVFCGVLAVPFLLPATIPGMTTVFGVPMLLIGFAVMASRVPWLPERMLERRIAAPAARQMLARVRGWALKFEHLVRPRALAMSGGVLVNVANGALLMLAVGLLMAPLPLVPFANTLPAIAIILLCFGMAERDGLVIALGWLATAVSAVYVGGLLVLVVYWGMHHESALAVLRQWFQ
ncbi:MAG: exopolysaccharide biosynthesis protein [Steroidobacteraceae bacterium]|nr:exopolysaccharide biosynthesis protein [Steroidobacteraceae bacterium]